MFALSGTDGNAATRCCHASMQIVCLDPLCYSSMSVMALQSMQDNSDAAGNKPYNSTVLSSSRESYLSKIYIMPSKVARYAILKFVICYIQRQLAQMLTAKKRRYQTGALRKQRSPPSSLARSVCMHQLSHSSPGL